MSTVKKSYVTFDLCVSFRVISLKVKKKKKKLPIASMRTSFGKFTVKQEQRDSFFAKER